MPIYYAGLLINSFIGNTGSSQVVELDVDDPFVTGYAAYEHGQIARVAFVNLQPWLSNTHGDRPSASISVAFTSPGNSSSTVQALMNGNAQSAQLLVRYADDRANLTFERRSYETPDALPNSATAATESLNLADGPISLMASEAVIVTFESVAGTSSPGKNNVTSPLARNSTAIVAGVISGILGAAVCVAVVWYVRRRYAMRKL